LCVKDWGPKPFKSFDVWLKEPGFKVMEKDKWDSYEVQGNSMSILKDKLKLLKVDLKEWNKNVFGCVESNKRRILSEIEELDGKDDDEGLEETGRMRRMELLSQLGMVDKKLDSIYRKKKQERIGSIMEI